MELWIKIKTKVNFKRLKYPVILVFFMAVIAGLFVWTIVFLSGAINNSISPDLGKADSAMMNIDLPAYDSAVKKLGLSSGEKAANDDPLYRDAARINDIRTIRDALASYAAVNSGKYPKELGALVPEYLVKVPTDPFYNNQYSYSYYPPEDPVKYHLGASLEGANAVLESDSDLDTRTSPGGFDGNDEKKCGLEDFGYYCYDVINNN